MRVSTRAGTARWADRRLSNLSWGVLLAAAALVAGVVAPSTTQAQALEEPPDAVILAERGPNDLVGKLIVGGSSWRYTFGYAVAVDGDLIAIGAPRAVADQGRAYILYDFAGFDSYSVQFLTCEHEAQRFPDGNCGRAMAAHENRVAVGMPHWPRPAFPAPEPPLLDDRGAVWVLEYDGAQWVEWELLYGGVLGGYFGEAVALEDDLLAVGVPLANINSDSSHVRLFEPSGAPDTGSWEQAQQLEPPGEDTNFAWNIDMQGSTLVLGATGAAYVFHGSPGNYTLSQELDYGGFGKVDVALHGDWLAVGNHDEGGGPPGAVHVYKWNGSTYVDKQTLTPPAGDHELYGWSVAIHGDTLLVGDPRDHGEAPYAGAVHRYTRSGDSWTFAETMTAYDAADSDLYGWDVAISSDWIIVGAPYDDNDGGEDSGAIYVYSHDAAPPPPPGPKCDGVPATIFGTAGDDHLEGTAGPDVIAGLGGNDLIEGLGGGDLICGGAGDDVIRAGRGADEVLGGGGDDAVSGNGGHDILYGGPGNDVLVGNAGNDIIEGELGNDKLIGKAGDDSLYGGGGRDNFVGGAGADFIWGDSGVDTVVYASAGGPVQVDLKIGIVTGGAGDDILTAIRNVIGSRFADTLTGNGLSNVLKGGGGNDRIYGKAGNDVLRGGLGVDWLYGGPGTDNCHGENEVGCEP